MSDRVSELSAGQVTPDPPRPGSVEESVTLAFRAVSQAAAVLPRRTDLDCLRRYVDDTLSVAAERRRIRSTVVSLQRAAGHMGVMADETDLSGGPFGVEEARRLRSAAAALRRSAAALGPGAAATASRNGMIGRIEALSTFSLVVRQPAEVVAHASQWLSELRREIGRGSARGSDRQLLAAELSDMAALLNAKAVPMHAEGSEGRSLLQDRTVLFARTADWIRHPSHGAHVMVKGEDA